MELFAGLRPTNVYAVVGEPFEITCSLRHYHPPIDSSMLEFCIQKPDHSIVAIDDSVHIVSPSSVRLVYTLHQPVQNIARTRIMCLLRSESNISCSRTNPHKSPVIMVGCERLQFFHFLIKNRITLSTVFQRQTFRKNMCQSFFFINAVNDVDCESEHGDTEICSRTQIGN